MIKVEDLRKRRREWISTLADITADVVCTRNSFRSFCHHPKCRVQDKCPQDHIACNAELGPHTAVAWSFVEALESQVIEPLRCLMSFMAEEEAAEEQRIYRCHERSWKYTHDVLDNVVQGLEHVIMNITFMHSALSLHSAYSLELKGENKWKELKLLIATSLGTLQQEDGALYRITELNSNQEE